MTFITSSTDAPFVPAMAPVHRTELAPQMPPAPQERENLGPLVSTEAGVLTRGMHSPAVIFESGPQPADTTYWVANGSNPALADFGPPGEPARSGAQLRERWPRPDAAG